MAAKYGFLFGAALVLLLTACNPPAADETFTVNTGFDTIDANVGDGTCADANGNCSLRAAIMEGNANPNTTEIILTQGEIYRLSIEGRNEDASASGDLDLTERTYIRAAGAADTQQATVDAEELDRAFDIHSGHFHFLEGLFITGGLADGSRSGGAIRISTGLVGIEDTTIWGNSAGGDGGGIYADGGTVWVEDSTIAHNEAFGDGGGIFATTNVRLNTNTTLDRNASGFGEGLFTSQVHQEAGELFAHQATITATIGVALVIKQEATITNSIISGKTRDCTFVGSGTITTSTHNVYSGTTCSPTTTDVIAPVTSLGPLVDNGGPVLTRMPLETFPSVDLIALSDPTCIGNDARQQPRGGNGCDAGALETQPGEAIGADCTSPPNLVPGAQLQNCDLRTADISGANLSGANLNGANLSGTSSSGGNFTGANLTSANLAGADFNSDDFSGASIGGADFSGASFLFVNLGGATGTPANTSASFGLVLCPTGVLSSDNNDTCDGQYLP